MLTANKAFYRDQVTEGGEGMTEENQIESETSEAPQEDLVKTLEQLKAEKEAIQAKNQELILKMQKVSESKREAEERARMEAEEKAKKAGDYEQLFKSQEQKTKEYEQRLAELQSNIAREKEQGTAMMLANELAEGPNAELLSEFIARRLKFTDDGVRVTDMNGQLTVSTLDDLKSEFKTNTKFASLLKGTRASGGSAPGGAGSAPVDKVINRAQFDEMHPTKRLGFIKDGGRVID